MAVTNNATLIEDFEGAGPSFSSIGGGAGASLNDDIIINGTQSAGRRADNKTDFGFFANPGATTDLSTAGTHVKFFLWVTQYLALTALGVRIGSTTTAYEQHAMTVSEYPPLGGWFPVWVEVDAGTDNGTPNFTIADEFAVVVSIGDVGGNASNLIMDQIHASERPVMTWDGATGAFSNFASTDDSNALGAFIQLGGVYFLYGNVQLGSATATTFTDSGVVIVAPEFSHLPSGTTWQGVDIDLQNASTVITWTDSVYGASDPGGATRKPDLIVSGTSGTADLSRNQFAGLRVLDLTSGVTMNRTTITNSGLITANDATLTNCSITDAAGAVALLWDTATDTNGNLDGTSFTMGASDSHAIEFGPNTPSSVTLTNVFFNDYNGGGTNDEEIYNNSGGALTINISGGDTPAVRNGAGASTTVVNSKTISVTVVDAETLQPVESARVLLEAAAGAGTNALPVGESVTITRSGSTATVTHTAHGIPDGEKVVIRYAAQHEYNGIKTVTVTGVNTYTYTVTGTPTTPATIASGFSAIECTGVVLEGLTNVSGVLSRADFPYSGTQDVTGTTSKSSATKFRRKGVLAGQIGLTGFATTTVMTSDE